MSAKIIDFAERKNGKKPVEDQYSNARLSEARPRRLADRLAIREAIARNRPFTRSDDARTAALRLTEMLDTARSRGISLSGVADRAFPGRDIPLKRLDKVSLPRKGGTASEARLGRLDRHPRNYAEVIKALAVDLERSAEDMLLDVFRGTSVEGEMETARDRIASGSDALDNWEILASLIQTMASSVSRRTGLPDHLRSIATVRGRYDPATQSVTPARATLLPHGPLAYGFEVMDEAPPIPSWTLFEQLRVPPFHRVLHFQVEPNMENRPDLPVEVAILRELRLAIGPADESETPRALFEVRTRVDLESEDGPVLLTRPWLYLGDEKSETVEVTIDDISSMAQIDLGPPDDVDWQQSTSLSGSPSWVPLEGEGHGFEGTALQPEHVYAAWYPVTAETCRELLNLDVSDVLAVGLDEVETTSATVLPSGTVGAAVEAALMEKQTCIADQLEAEARVLVALVQKYVSARREEALTGHDQAREWWNRR